MAHNLADEIWATILKTILNVPDDDFISYKTSLGPFSHRDYSNADVLLKLRNNGIAASGARCNVSEYRSQRTP